MLNFSELVERKDHKPFVRQYSTTGSQAVVVADLEYYEPTTVQRQVTEAVLSVHLSTVLIEAEIGGSKRALFPYTPGLFDLTPSHTNYSSERNDPGSAIALSLPSQVIAEVLGEIAPGFNQDFAGLHDRPHGSDLIVALCRQILSEVANQSNMGPLYSDTLVQSLILELYRLSRDESSAWIADTKKKYRQPL